MDVEEIPDQAPAAALWLSAVVADVPAGSLVSASCGRLLEGVWDRPGEVERDRFPVLHATLRREPVVVSYFELGFPVRLVRRGRTGHEETRAVYPLNGALADTWQIALEVVRPVWLFVAVTAACSPRLFPVAAAAASIGDVERLPHGHRPDPTTDPDPRLRRARRLRRAGQRLPGVQRGHRLSRTPRRELHLRGLPAPLHEVRPLPLHGRHQRHRLLRRPGGPQRPGGGLGPQRDRRHQSSSTRRRPNGCCATQRWARSGSTASTTWPHAPSSATAPGCSPRQDHPQRPRRNGQAASTAWTSSRTAWVGWWLREALLAMQADQRGSAEQLVHRIVTLGTPHRGIAFQRAPRWLTESLPMARDGSDEFASFSPDSTRFLAIEDFFPVERILTVVGTDFRTYGVSGASAVNRLSSLLDEGSLTTNRSDGLVKQSAAQLPGAPRTFVHKSPRRHATRWSPPARPTRSRCASSTAPTGCGCGSTGPGSAGARTGSAPVSSTSACDQTALRRLRALPPEPRGRELLRPVLPGRPRRRPARAGRAAAQAAQRAR